MTVKPAFVRAIVTVAIVSSLFWRIDGVAQDRKCVTPAPADDPKFKPGQVWTYKTRQGKEASTLTILRIESTPKLGMIVHIRVDGFRFKNCTGGPAPHTLEHAPFSRAAIDSSVVKLLRTVEVPPYENGYNDWLAHCGGVYTISVADALAADDATFRSGLGCSAK